MTLPETMKVVTLDGKKMLAIGDFARGQITLETKAKVQARIANLAKQLELRDELSAIVDMLD